MTLHYNNPDRATERAESQPLSIEENNQVVSFLNEAVRCLKQEQGVREEELHLLQRFIDHKENLESFYDTTGGSARLTKLNERANALFDIYINLKEVVAELEKHEPIQLVQAVITAHKVTLDALRQALLDTAYNATDEFYENL